MDTSEKRNHPCKQNRRQVRTKSMARHIFGLGQVSKPELFEAHENAFRSIKKAMEAETPYTQKADTLIPSHTERRRTHQ